MSFYYQIYYITRFSISAYTYNTFKYQKAELVTCTKGV